MSFSSEVNALVADLRSVLPIDAALMRTDCALRRIECAMMPMVSLRVSDDSPELELLTPEEVGILDDFLPIVFPKRSG